MTRSFEQDLVEHCAPTMAGLKSANLFHVRTQDAPALYERVAYWQDVLQRRGLTLTILKECSESNSVLVYLYRKTKLEAELALPATQDFLHSEGYVPGEGCEGYLAQLSHRLCVQQAFPHEIGLFLGYPLEDVLGFIAHKGKNFTYCGHWKTYGDASAARAQFERFHHCTRTYLRCFSSGFSINRLAVAA